MEHGWWMKFEWWRPLLAIFYLALGYSIGWDFGYYKARMGWDGFCLLLGVFVLLFAVAQYSAIFP